MKAKIFKAAEADWIEAPGHHSAFSKLLINETDGSKYFDFRVSSYQPKGYCEVHTHQIAENIYYILRGEGIMELDGQRHLVSPGTVVFIPAGVEHGIANTGFEDLIFVVAASPPQDMPRPE
ncbi:MAG: cupin domain-containing protein [Desulfobacterales bacterium]|nr:MAG: cupin domain-containing protein [Desulfobacterales bacterium]